MTTDNSQSQDNGHSESPAPVSPSSNELYKQIDALLPAYCDRRDVEVITKFTARLLLQAHLEEVNLIDQDGGHDESFYRYAKKRRVALTKQMEE